MVYNPFEGIYDMARKDDDWLVEIYQSEINALGYRAFCLGVACGGLIVMAITLVYGVLAG